MAQTVLRAANHTPAQRSGGRIAWAAACLLALVLVAWPGAAGAARKVTTLGATQATPRPACPGSPCEAIGKVTGFQSTAGTVKRPFQVPYNGKAVAWSITTSKPKASQVSFFNDFYGSPPEARLAVLKQVTTSRDQPARSAPRYKLLRQSPAVGLSPYLGRSPTFALDRPLTVRRGNVVALTIPTWAPAFAVGLADNSGWRASRKRGQCTRTSDIKESRPQQKVGSEKQYGCFYRTARLLYRATIVKGG
jgi:hypothetical protein